MMKEHQVPITLYSKGLDSIWLLGKVDGVNGDELNLPPAGEDRSYLHLFITA
jgi:hypothetical protein